jgi:probable H4MPT-linked C1 transfer pathway protein
VSRPYEIWREKDRLPEVLYEVCSQLFPDEKPEAFAVTMTAELSDIFRNKREGVTFVLESVRACFPDPATYVLSLSGEFVPIDDAMSHPLNFAATNLLASARWIAQKFPDCLLVDVGSTTTDILPILNGEVHVTGRTDWRAWRQVNWYSPVSCAPTWRRSCKRCLSPEGCAGLLPSTRRQRGCASHTRQPASCGLYVQYA